MKEQTPVDTQLVLAKFTDEDFYAGKHMLKSTRSTSFPSMNLALAPPIPTVNKLVVMLIIRGP